MKLKRLLVLFVPLFGLLALFSGCSSPGDLSGLSVELLKLEHAADGSVVATLQFNNGAVQSMNIAASTHQLSLNGQPPELLTIKEPLGLPAQRSATQVVTLKIPGASLPASGTVEYKLSSVLTFVLYDEQKEQDKFSHSGTAPIK